LTINWSLKEATMLHHSQKEEMVMKVGKHRESEKKNKQTNKQTKQNNRLTFMFEGP